MAALRLVARRLGGQRLQAPVAIVEEAQRRLLPRLFDGRSRSTSSAAGYEPPTSNGGNQGLAVDERECLASRLREIHNKIEELYNLTSEGLAVDKRSCLREIHNKIEELYNLTSEVEKNYFMPSKASFHIRGLREDLSVQVDPRPNDREWHRLRAINTLYFYGRLGLTILGAYMVVGMLDWVTNLDPGEMRGMQKERMEAKQEQ